MSLISLILVLAIAGFCAWAILQIPGPQPVKNIIIGVIILFVVIWVLQSLGVNTGLPRLTLK